jgi:hypothetical protein
VDFAVGVNVFKPIRASVADQNATLGQNKAAGVQVIGAWIRRDDTVKLQSKGRSGWRHLLRLEFRFVGKAG